MSEDSETVDMAGAGLVRGSGTALWRQIAEKIEEEILSTAWRPGEQLPTEHQLSVRFGVNRHTVRRAVAALADKGLVRIEQGRGSFVQEAVIDYRVRKRTRFSENMAAQKRSSGGRILKVVGLKADAAVAQALDLPEGAPVAMVERLGEADGRPLSISAHYFPAARLPGIEEAFRRTSSVTEALRGCGVADYSRQWTRVTARLARAADSRLLAQPVTRPILMTESLNVDSSGRPIEYCLSRWASDRVQLVFETTG
jgi:GntR family phosphonate transport system transcriptional regulator